MGIEDLSGLADFDVMEAEPEVDRYKDEFDPAVRFAFVGAGQAGGRFVEMAYQLGWRRVLAVNTYQGDLDSLTKLPADNKLLIGESTGAGKDPAQSLSRFQQYTHDIFDALHTCFGPDVDQVLVCAGAGGGTGTGALGCANGSPALNGLLDTVHRYLGALPERTEPRRVGVVVSIPADTEQAGVCANAYETLLNLFEVPAEIISPKIVIDNNRITKIWPKITSGEKWSRVNGTVFSTLKALTVLAKTSSETPFDPADFTKVLSSGTLIFGALDVKDPSSTELAKAVRVNAERGLLAEGFDLTQGKTAAAIAVGPKDVIDAIPVKDMEYAMQMFAELLGRKGITLHRGVYAGPFPVLRLYTMIGGLPIPAARLEKLRTRVS